MSSEQLSWQTFNFSHQYFQHLLDGNDIFERSKFQHSNIRRIINTTAFIYQAHFLKFYMNTNGFIMNIRTIQKSTRVYR